VIEEVLETVTPKEGKKERETSYNLHTDFLKSAVPKEKIPLCNQ
jgi:hypothetical protein